MFHTEFPIQSKQQASIMTGSIQATRKCPFTLKKILRLLNGAFKAKRNIYKEFVI